MTSNQLQECKRGVDYSLFCTVNFGIFFLGGIEMKPAVVDIQGRFVQGGLV